jgi:CHAD domain-containing protein
MAKARDIDGLHPDMAFRDAALVTVRVRAEELWEQSVDVLDTTDIERVHDMRVASRRLRAVLEIYAPCFPRHEHRAVLKDVKALADALGARRDPDVQLEDLDGLAGALDPADGPGLEYMRAQLTEQQRAGNVLLAGALAQALEHDLKGRLDRLAGVPPADDGAVMP